MCPPSAADAGQASNGIRGPRRRFQAPGPYERLFRATAKAVAEEGYEQAGIESICASCGIPTALFRAHFKSKQEAVLHAVDEFSDRVIRDCKFAFEQAASWPEGVWAVSTVFTDWGACEPDFARLGIVEMGGAGKPAQELIGELLDTFAMFLDPGYEQFADRGLKKGSLDKEIGARLNAFLSERIRRDSAQTLPRIAPDLTRIALTPFLGEAETERFVAEKVAAERR